MIVPTNSPLATLSRRRFLGTIVLLPLLATTASAAATRTLRGKVLYRERMALPRNALIEVSLIDVSRADAPSITIARTRIRKATASPIAYALNYDPSRIEPGHSYALQARITIQDGGKERLLFINTTRHPMFGGGVDKTDIHVERVRHSPPPPAKSIVGEWLAEDILGGGVLDRVQTVLIIAADGRVSGRGGCNGFGGEATIKNDRIRFGRMFSTQMACTEAVMNQEHKFLTTLNDVRRFRIDPRQRKLFLMNDDGRAIIQLTAM